MAAAQPTSGAAAIGAKGTSLSSSAVYAIATAGSSSPSSAVRRAALAVLLHKLHLSPLSSQSAAIDAVDSALRLPSPTLDALDLSSPSKLLSSISDLTAIPVDDASASAAAAVFSSSSAAAVGVSALIDCVASSLVRVSDAVAAISCEAARIDASAALDVAVSGDGVSVKDELDVASDMKMLLFGSKLAGVGGDKENPLFEQVPAVHGSFRQAVRSLHDRVRIELSLPVKVRSVSESGSDGKERALLALAQLVDSAAHNMREYSLDRVKLAVEFITDQKLRDEVSKVVSAGSPTAEAAVSGSQRLATLVSIYEHLLKLRELIAQEAAISLFAIDLDDSVEKPTAEVNVADAKGDKKERRKKKTLGKGTSVVLAILMGQVTNSGPLGSDLPIIDWTRELSLFFDAKNADLENFIAKLKELVESNESRRLPKIPKGTRDFGKEQMAIRERAFSIITSVFKMHGAGALDTPVFELRETLMGKYGEDSKLIYDLADQGGELCSLRYDLTVPFARYLAMNNINAMKRYQIAKVYRRDNPSKGRFREFYQCDFDIAGVYEPMEPDFEVIKLLTELLDQLNIGTYEVKFNHRKLLDGMLEICGVPPEKFRTICSSIDKLDKQTFEQIKKEMVEEKGLAIETAEKIGTFVKIRGPPLEVLAQLRKEESPFLENNGSTLALNDLEILFNALDKAKSLDKIVFDLSLARGLDYYTGVIYEAVSKGTTQVGSIAAGGRYDNLVGMFSGKQVPAVGVSLGIERVFAIMEQQAKEKKLMIRATETQVLVGVLDNDLTLAAEIVSKLWAVKIKAEFKLTKKKVMNFITYATQSGIPWMVLVGETERSKGTAKLKNIEANQEEEVHREHLVEELRRRLNV